MRQLKIVLLLLLTFYTGVVTAATLPSGFVYLNDVAPDIMLDIRYASADNFIGKPIDGYVKPVAITTSKTASALKNAQADFKRFGLGLKVFDAYRPQRAVDHFVRWAKDWRDTLMKSRYYPQIAKQDLFQKEYIAAKSGHSRGSTVDVTLSYVEANGLAHELDMGTGFDFFDPRSWPEYPDLTAAQRANRMLLQVVMEKHGFKPYPKDWWHFNLKQESYPDTYFIFVVE